MNTTTDNVDTDMFPVQDEQQVSARISAMYSTRALTPGALGAFLEALEPHPHVAADEPADTRLCLNEDRVLVDAIREAGESVLKQYSEMYRRNAYAQTSENNFVFLDHKETDETLNECGLCCCEKSKCVDPATHFGSRGELTPDSECPTCGKNLWNNYDSEHRLALHRAEGTCDASELAIHTRMKLMPPQPIQMCLDGSSKTRAPKKSKRK